MADSADRSPSARPAPAAARPGIPPAAPPDWPAATTPRRPPPRRWLRRGLLLLLPLVLIIAFARYLAGGGTVSTDDAYVEADTVGVSTDVSGIVHDVDVHDNERVAKGQILYRLDDLPFRIALARADAQLGVVRDSIQSLQADYGNMNFQIKQAEDDLAYFQREFDRQQYLKNSRVASEQTLDAARRNLQNAQQKLAALGRQQAGIAANLDEDPTGPVEHHPRYRAALAQRDEAARELAHTAVAAPFAGIVTQVPAVQPGKYLAAATVGFYLVASDHVWVDADPKETELTDVRPGQRATVTVDAYPGITWHGTVESISPAAAQQFALLPAENTSGNWVKVVQRVPIRIRIDSESQNAPALRAGLSAEVRIDTARAQ